MLLQIIRPNGPTLDLEVDERLVVIAGPNGEGKSTLLKELGTEYQRSPRGSGIPHPGAMRDNVRLSSHLVTVEQLSSYNLLLTPDPNRPNTLTQSFGITFEDVKEAFSDQDGIRLSLSARHVRALITPEEHAAVAANPREIDRVYRKYFTRLLPTHLPLRSQSFRAYHEEYASRRYGGQDPEAIRTEIGGPPWQHAQARINRLGLDYVISAPDIDSVLPHRATFKLVYKGGSRAVPGDRLSSGERVVLALYDIMASDSTSRRIFLFDDLDGFLHPPLLSRVIDVLHEILTEKDCMCIWVTHSPVFVQLARHASFFYIGEYGQDPHPITKAALIDRLSGGELVVADNFATVFVEGADVAFYKRLFQTLIDRDIVQPQRQVRFASPRSNPEGRDAGCHAVNDIVTVLNCYGFGAHFLGLVDLDNGCLTTHANVRKLPRYCKENYLFDPLNAYTWLVDTDLDPEGDLPRFADVGLGTCHQLTTHLSPHDLQAIIDYIASKILARQSLKSEEIENRLGQRQEVRLWGGITLQYPDFLVRGNGKKPKAP